VRQGNDSTGSDSSTRAEEAVIGVEVDIEAVLPVTIVVEKGMAAGFRQVLGKFATAETMKDGDKSRRLCIGGWDRIY